MLKLGQSDKNIPRKRHKFKLCPADCKTKMFLKKKYKIQEIVYQYVKIIETGVQKKKRLKKLLITNCLKQPYKSL